MAIDWKSVENNERLLTCVYAWLQESGMTINHHRIAQFFGNGATYDAVQGNFRKFKQRIEAVKAEAEEAGPAPVALSRVAHGKKTDGKKADGVLSGRVKKSAPKKTRTTKVKEEEGDDDEKSGVEEDGI